MFKLEERKKYREHMKAVNAGEIDDPVALHGTDSDGNVIVKGGKGKPGTAAKGRNNPETTTTTEESGGNGNGAVDYTKLTTHADLDAALGSRPKPEGWDDRKVAEKQAWLTENPVSAAGWN